MENPLGHHNSKYKEIAGSEECCPNAYCL